MLEASQLALNLIVGIIQAIPDSPLMFVLGLSIVASIYILILSSFKKL